MFWGTEGKTSCWEEISKNLPWKSETGSSWGTRTWLEFWCSSEPTASWSWEGMKRLRQKESENKELTPATAQHTRGRDVRDFRGKQNLHILHSPEEPLVQVTWSYREDVDHIVLLLLQLLRYSSTRESSEGRTNRNTCLRSTCHFNTNGHYSCHRSSEISE